MQIRTGYTSGFIKIGIPGILLLLLWIGLPQLTTRVLGWHRLEWLQGLAGLAAGIGLWAALYSSFNRWAYREGATLSLEGALLSARGPGSGSVDLAEDHATRLGLIPEGVTVDMTGGHGGGIYLRVRGGQEVLRATVPAPWWVLSSQLSSGDDLSFHDLDTTAPEQHAFVEATLAAIWAHRDRDSDFALFRIYPWSTPPRPRVTFAERYKGSLPEEVARRAAEIRAQALPQRPLGTFVTCDETLVEGGLGRWETQIFPLGRTRARWKLYEGGGDANANPHIYGILTLCAPDSSGAVIETELPHRGQRTREAMALLQFVNTRAELYAP